MKFLAAVLSGLVLASTVLAREPGFGEFRVVQESLRYLPPNIRSYYLDKAGFDIWPAAQPLPESTGLRLIGKWGGGPSVRVTGRDSFVYLSRGSEVVVINFADTANPRVLTYIQAPGLVARSILVGNRLYISSGYIETFDISDPANPVKLGSILARAPAIDVVDTLVYTLYEDSFKVFNFSDPTNPQLLGACRDSGYDLSVCNGYAYIGDRWGLYVLDVTNPATPHRIASWGSDVISVKARGNICCATTDNSSNPGVLRFTILDVRTPSNPIPLGSLDSCGAYDVFLDGQLAFLSGYYIFNEFRIVAISDSTHPQHVGTIATPDQNFGVWANPTEDLAYVADCLGGLIVIDITNLNAPVVRDTLLRAGIAYDVSVQDGFAFVADDGVGLVVLDVSIPSSVHEVASIDSTRDMMTRTIAVRDSFAFMGWLTHPWLKVVDVTDPLNPRKAASCDLFNPAEDMVWRDSFLYVAEGYRFQVVNAARPREPVLVGSCNLQNEVVDLWMTDTLGYVASYPSPIVDVSDPAHPTVVGSIPVAAYGVAVKDSIAYVAAVYDSVLIYNVVNPTMPVRLGIWLPSGGHQWHGDIEIVDTLLVVGGDWVHIASIADPLSPRELTRWSPPRDIRRLQYAAPFLYAACWDAGVCILDMVTTALHEAGPKEPRHTGVRLMPSPTHDRLTVEIPNTLREEVMCNAYTVAGARVPVPVFVSVGSGRTSLKLDLRSVSAGVYLLRVCVGKTVYLLRMTKL